MTGKLPMTTAHRIAIALTAGCALLAGLSACAPLVVGGAAAGAGMVATDRRTSGAQLDDETIELRAAARIREIASDNMNVSVTSFNRQVLLTGSVGSEANKVKAEDVARRVENVRGVFNELTVGSPTTFSERSSDTYITGKVKAALLDRNDIFANLFKVVTERGVVYLMGIVTRTEVDRATEAVRGVSGVRKIVRAVEIVTEQERANQERQPAAPAPAPVSDIYVPMSPAASGGAAPAR
jgi:osmotically-inducible protein OsmY